ncbi:hypothetical protein Clacol_000890 [Clathrus columnatus]|uniref:Aminoglycoside phosphotransferase domain-containing protein n=1 Tax=Clathrus columnatus TaxID=1419009 RepID=A0AAV5A115_9AGAM|nr:hypothetical protein Clacol_000890 [Clathrus columnatus]
MSSMSSTMSLSLIHPDKIFTDVPPLPRPWTISPQLTPSQGSSVSLKWKESRGLHRGPLRRFQTALRTVHKRKVTWPVDESALSDLPPEKYLKSLMQPIADLFTQLRSLKVVKRPVECISIELGEFIYGVTFSVETDLSGWLGTPPIILALNTKDLVDADGRIGFPVEYALSKALDYNPLATSVIMTNFSQIIIFSLPGWNRPEPIYDKISTDRPSLALRVLSAAYLYNVAPDYSIILEPPPIIESDPTLILPEGPPEDPSKPLLSDEELFVTHHRHSDFDLATLIRNGDRAHQFFRWKEYVQRSYPKVVAHSQDVLTGSTNNIGNMLFPKHSGPIYPYDPSEIPTDTAEHLKSIQRESPLVSCGIADSFAKSKTFTIEIQNVIAEGSNRGFCIVYKCRLTSIDNEPISRPSAPPLYLKLFDDRFQVLEKPDPVDDEERYENLYMWFDTFIVAEMYALNESSVYNKLRSVQGTVIPWFYGMHQFTLPNGMILYGLLMEYIDGCELTSSLIRNMSVDRQIKLMSVYCNINNCRHASRVLDVADVAQRDWHPGQLLIHNKLGTDIDHAVLIDFAMATQTWSLDEPNLLSNYFGVLRILSESYEGGPSGMDWKFAWKHFGEPDDWDPIMAFRGKDPESKEVMVLEARDMFPYISSA